MGRWGFGRLLVFGVAGILAVVGTAIAVLLFNSERFLYARQSVTHTRMVLSTVDSVVLDLLHIESGARGFAGTGEESYLLPLEASRGTLPGRIRHLRRLTSDNPAQQERCDRLESLALERVGLSESLVEARRHGGLAAALAVQATGRGRAAMEGIRELVDGMRAAEEALLAERLAVREDAEASLEAALLGLLGAVAAILVGTAILLRREYSRRAVAESRLQAILDHSPAVVYMRDVAGRFLVLNRRYTENTGIEVSRALGRTPEELYAPALAEQYARHHRRVLEEGPIEVEETAESGGRRRILLSLKFPLIGPDGEVTGVGGISTDITDRKAAEEAVRAAKEKAEAANRELEAFSYSVSHDLRAPLRGIDGFSQALVEDEADRLSERGKGYLGRIRAGAQHMGRLIDDLIELSRVSRTEIGLGPVDLSALAGGVVETLRAQEPQRRIEARVQAGVSATGDERLLRLVLENLLSNAWKYTGRTAEAIVEFGEEAAEGGRAFFVRDNGVGFDMRYAGKLFTPFQRMHSREDFPGTGIGLATVHRIVNRHRGRIWVDAAPGRGATFRFTLGEREAA